MVAATTETAGTEAAAAAAVMTVFSLSFSPLPAMATGNKK